MLAAGAGGKVGALFALAVFDVPRLHDLAVKFVDNNGEMLVRTNKHVVGSPVENDFLVVFKDDLMGESAGRSGFGTGEEPGIGRPHATVVDFNNIIIRDEGHLAVGNGLVARRIFQVHGDIAVLGERPRGGRGQPRT